MPRRFERRELLRLGALSGGWAGLSGSALAQGQGASPIGDAARSATSMAAAPDESDPAADSVVRLTGDGLSLTPRQFAHVLDKLVRSGVAADSYTLGGVVEALESRMAALLGKERAIFMPTGTLANHLAIRALAGGLGRAAVQAESHIYLDSGDCVQTLSGVTLMPLAPGRATFGADDLQRLLDQNRSGRVATRIGVVSIESPVRRLRGQTFDPAARAEVVALAQREGIKLHLDGARLFLEAAYARSSVAVYARPFETVYVSLYKYFNAPFGAILAGPHDLLDGMYHVRRMFGGGLSEAWPAAAVALHYLDGFDDRFRRAIDISEELARRLSADGRFAIAREPLGTNLMRLTVKTGNPEVYRQRLLERGVALGAPSAGGAFLLATNETLNRSAAEPLAQAFVQALSA